MGKGVRLPRELLIETLSYILPSFPEISEKHEDLALASYLSRVISLLFIRRSIQASEHGSCPFLVIFQKHVHTQATMPYDKIYALRGLNETIGVPDITISYDHSVQQAYAHFVKRWIKRYSNLDIITNYIESQNRVAPHLPSWVPDWSGKQICSRWDVGTSNTWGRSGGFSAWTVGPNREETPSTWLTVGHPE